MRYTQPQSGSVRIDRNNPISRGLEIALNWSARPAVDLVKSRPIAYGANINTSSITPMSLGLCEPFVTNPYNNQQGLSVPAWTNTTNEATVLLLQFRTGDNTCYAWNSYGTGGDGQEFLFAGEVHSGAFWNSRWLAAPPPASIDIYRPHVMVMTVKDGAQVGYFNGKSFASNSLSGGFGLPPTLQIRTDADSAMGVVLTLFFSRALSAGEVASLSANPWQLFADDDTDWLRSAAVTNPLAALAWLEQSDTTSIAATATTPVAASLSWAEASDSTALAAKVTNASQLSWTEANDTTAVTAKVVGTAALSWAESNDQTSIVAAVTNASALAWTEASDTSAISATVTNASSLAWVEANDSTAINASTTGVGTAALAWSEQNDTCAIIATAINNGSLAWAEANDVTAIAAVVPNTATAALSWAEQSDANAIAVVVTNSTGLAWAEQSDSTAITALFAQGISASLIWAEQTDGSLAVQAISTGAADYGSRPKQYVVKRGEQLFIYRSKAQALAAFRAEQEAQDEQASAKTRKVAQKAIQRAEKQAISLPEVEQYAKNAGRIEQYQQAYTSEHLDTLLAMFNDMRDEGDIELLMLTL